MKLREKTLRRTKSVLQITKFDVWGSQMVLRKRNRWAYRILHRLEYNLRQKIALTLRRSRMQLIATYAWSPKFRRPPRRWHNTVKDYKLYKTLPYLEKFVQANRSIKKPALFFSNLFSYYQLHKSFFANPTNKLVDFWQKSYLFKIALRLVQKLGYYNYRYFYASDRQLPYVRQQSSRETARRELYRLANYYCLYNKNRLRSFLSNAHKKSIGNSLYLGLEGTLINLLFRTNLFLTTRHAYVFLKIGGVHVNDHPSSNPYQLLRLYDQFSLTPFFLKRLMKIYLARLKKNLILVNCPNYLSYNYKIGHFFIWRLPTQEETNFVYSFPFSNKVLFGRKLFTYQPPKSYLLNDLKSTKYGFPGRKRRTKI